MKESTVLVRMNLTHFSEARQSQLDLFTTQSSFVHSGALLDCAAVTASLLHSQRRRQSLLFITSTPGLFIPPFTVSLHSRSAACIGRQRYRYFDLCAPFWAALSTSRPEKYISYAGCQTEITECLMKKALKDLLCLFETRSKV